MMQKNFSQLQTSLKSTYIKTNQKVKKLKGDYYKATPKRWRKIGDAMQDIAITGSAIIALVASPPAWIPVAIFAAGRIGKIITNFSS